MPKIQNVDYEAIPAQAKSMRNYGQELNTQLTTAYKSIENMHKSWYGKRYNELVKQFNNVIPQINELLELVVGEIPFALETVANNYSQADRGSNATSASKTSPKKISNIPVSNDVGLRFITSEVNNTQKSVSDNFKNAKGKMDAIESTYNRIKWESEAATAFKSRFTKLKSQIVKAFEDINSQFTRLMTQTQQDMQSTESANTVS